MRIGILTYHFSYNFGAMIQAFALRRAIKDMVSPDDVVDIINYKPASFQNEGEGSLDNRILHRTEKRERFLKEKCDIQGVRVSNIYHAPEYDYYITGSDQVWNPNLPVYDETSEYFLDFVRDGKIRISYAASIGEDVSKDINISLFEKNIPKFNYLSIREQSHIPFIEQFTDKRCVGVLDPTFLIDKNIYEQMMPSRKKESDHILCVTYNMKARRRIYDLANRYAILNHLKIIHMDTEVSPYMFLNDEETMNYEGIEEILWAIRNAKMVITDSFHFMVFSIIFHKPFYLMPSARNVRVLDLLQYLQLEDRILRDNIKLQDLDEHIDYEEVDELIADKKNISLEFLKTALNIVS